MPSRSKLKKVANQQHDQEKEHMVTMHAFGISTSIYAGDNARPECNDDGDDEAVEDQQQDEVTPFENIPILVLVNVCCSCMIVK